MPSFNFFIITFISNFLPFLSIFTANVDSTGAEAANRVSSSISLIVLPLNSIIISHLKIPALYAGESGGTYPINMPSLSIKIKALGYSGGTF